MDPKIARERAKVALRTVATLALFSRVKGGTAVAAPQAAWRGFKRLTITRGIMRGHRTPVPMRDHELTFTKAVGTLQTVPASQA